MDRKLLNRLQTVLNTNNKKDLFKTPRDPEPPEDDTTTEEEEKSIEDYYGFNPLTERERLKEEYGEGGQFDSGVFETQNTKIFGMPHQFLETADFRIDGSNKNFGYCFAKEIFMEKPMVTLIPGKPNYLPDYSKGDTELFNKLSIEQQNNEDAKNMLGELIDSNEESRYYDFTSDYSTYIKYVNLMCRAAAIFLGIGDREGPDGKTAYKDYNWANYQSFNSYSSGTDDKNIFNKVSDGLSDTKDTLYSDFISGERTFVNFIIDPNSSVTENISNTTQKSQLEGAFDSMEGIVKEASMFMSSASDFTSNNQSYLTKAGEAILSLGNMVSFGLFKKLLGAAEEHVLHGSNLIYPEIWMDSEYSKTYSLKIKLVSPYGSRESIYLNIFVPMFHALCLTLPKQTSANSFTSPFLVRGYSQGWFSIDMGMVESIDIDKGPEQSWSVEGLPTQCDITLTIKDFYSQLMMTKSNEIKLFWTNQGLIDFLGVTCGLDLSKPNIIIKMNVLTMLVSGTVTDLIPNTYLKLSEGFKSKIRGFFE